jgi:hydroxyacylglutathione hydrolase
MILNTHHHGDHIAGNKALKEVYGCTIYGPEAEKDKIDGLDHLLKEGDRIEIGNVKAHVIETPGHTLGHICFYVEELRALFAGDTLFSLGCGRLFEGTAAQMFDSIAKLKALPDETRLYCGHEYTMSNADFAFTLFPKNENLHLRAQMVKTLRAQNRPSLPVTMGLEKMTNPFCLAETVEEFADFRARKDAA